MNHRAVAAAVCSLSLILLFAAGEPGAADRLAGHRNLGKAFYENPTTAKEAVEEFRKAFQLSPNSNREKLNYALALLRAGSVDQAVKLLQEVQEAEPSLPHTWFNLGIVWKKAGETERALAQFAKLATMAPSNAIVRYNYGALLRSAGRLKEAMTEFETSSKLDHSLAAPHFQLFNLYRTGGRPDEAKQELERFQQLKKTQEGAPSPEDVEWTDFAEVYDPPPSPSAELPPLEPVYQPGSTPAASVELSAAVRADFDNDGAADALVLTQEAATIHKNRAGKFTAQAPLASGAWHGAVAFDYDHDYDLDLLLLGREPRLMRNAGAAGWQDRTADIPFDKACEPLSATSFRVVPDTKGFDLVISCRNREAILYRDALLGKFAAEPTPLPAGAEHLAAADLDNDGTLDLLFVRDGNIQVARNTGRAFAAPAPAGQTVTGRYVVTDPDLRGRPRTYGGTTSCAPVEARDFDKDGREDVLCSENGKFRWLMNRTPVKDRNWIAVSLEGVRSAKLASGAEVEVKAGALYQKRQYDGAPLVFSLGSAKTADTVRITWPNGLIQNETAQPAGRVHHYKEAQRLSGSCPIVWTWNGSAFQYITDILGVAPLGASSGDGSTFPVDPDEYIQIPDGALAAKQDGTLEIRMTEELSEVAYLDRVRLLAIDHPDGTALLTNEKFKSPPFPDFRLFATGRAIAPATARDAKGNDVRSRILAVDNTYPDRFERDMKGRAREHSLQLSFDGEAASLRRPVLVLHGWVDWADGSTFRGASQEGGAGFIPPRLEARGADGVWRTVLEDMGMPAGKPKTIAVDLTGKLPPGNPELRIVTNLCVYWDRIALAEDTGADMSSHEARLTSATLRFRGFSPNYVHPERRQPEQFRYEGARPSSMWNPTPGLYTRFGDVLELALKADDTQVVIGSGDELLLLFDGRELPALRPGYRRSYLFGVDGWAKDRDPNTVHGQSVLPLPWRGMKNYGDPLPDTPEHREWQKRYLTRPALRPLRPLT
ncbi:MAG TPA: FG-GAP-like repeat-containing protein [Bryobacteraceae bacterium]|nr:FG-GAP-like repeat-containing protein [Bryobacteraceae bacterium]